jgi:S1-C subfamily serine protease
MPLPSLRRACLLALACVLALPPAALADNFPATIAAVKPAIVGVGSYMRTRSPAITFAATGFVVGDGLSVITNAHGVAPLLDVENRETMGVVVKTADGIDFRPATLAGIDKTHDLAHLRLAGAPLPALKLGDPERLAEGQNLAFTGFPLGMVLGLHHVSHRATLGAITPIVIPAMNSGKLDPKAIAQLQRKPFIVFQLDGTAYPGNSGSPVYDPDTGTVYGVINMVFVKGLKENAITNPSGITYAIPASYVKELLLQKADTK